MRNRLLWSVLAFATLLVKPALAQTYKLTADSEAQAGVPKGEVTRTVWKSKIFPGTERDYWVYVPKQYDPAKPACLMIFQDGGGFQDNGGGFRTPIVFDNLIHKKEMPVTIGVFLNPGVVPASRPNALPRFNRSVEYDGMGDLYPRFLIEEILPDLEKKYNITKDPNGRATCGSSSGGIAAFTVAWERPDQFRRVLSFIGSFTNLRGGHHYPSMIRKMEPKPLRVFMQDGSNDQDIYSGSWFIGNNDVYAALRYARYDVQYVVGTGGHDGVQARAIFPDALRWLWRDYPAPIALPNGTPQPVMQVVLPKEEWTPAATDLTGITAIAPDGQGGLYVADAGAKRISKLEANGTLTTLREGVEGVRALSLASDGRLIAALAKRVVAWDKAGKERTILAGVSVSGMAVNRAGEIYVSDAKAGKVWYVSVQGKKRVVAEGVAGANALQLTPDQSLLIVSHEVQASGVADPPLLMTSFQIQKDGSLAHGQLFFDVQTPHGHGAHLANGMAVDTEGRLFVATNVGVQFCDQAGRVNGILLNPLGATTSQIAFAGLERTRLFAVAEGKLYQRNTRAKGVYSFEDPLRPPSPRL